jgi:CubicO group peptidase (beta-lactamase class C family)
MNLTKNMFFLLTILSCSSFSQSSNQSLDAVIEPQIANGNFRSVIIGSYEEASIEEFYSYGGIAANDSSKPTSKNIFEIGSLSKVFTGLILSSLHLDGTLTINDKVSSVLKSLKGKPAGNITLLELATHMSGLARIPSNLTIVDMKDPYAKYTEKNLLSYLKSLKEIKKPKLFSWKNYSNTGFGLLGYILQKKTNLTYEELVKKHITNPLGMKNTYVNVPEDKIKLFVPGHNELLEETSYWLLLNSMNGAGALKSTASDLMLFLKANISPKNTSIEDVLRFSQKPRYVDGNKGIGIAWGLKLENTKVQGIGHNGGTGGFVSDFQFDVNKKKGFMYLTNTSNTPQCVAAILITSEECMPKFSRPVDSILLDKYVGTYTNKKTGLTFVLTKHFNQLVYSLPGQEMGKTTSINDIEFSIKGIAFIRFNQGEDKFEFEQNKAKLIFIKTQTAE